MDATSKYVYRLLVAAAIALIAGGTVFYHLVEKWSLLDAYYFCVVTLATVGYGDLVPKTDAGKLFTTFYILIGIGIVATFATSFVKIQGAKAKHRHEDRHKQ